MIRIFYVKDGFNIVGEYISKDFIPDVDYLDITNIETPSVPPESWYVDGGELKVDYLKLAEINRQNMPNLTPIEFDIKLNNAGLYDAVQELIKDNFELRIAYTRAIFFSRTDPFIIALGLTDEQVDELWTAP